MPTLMQAMELPTTSDNNNNNNNQSSAFPDFLASRNSLTHYGLYLAQKNDLLKQVGQYAEEHTTISVKELLSPTITGILALSNQVSGDHRSILKRGRLPSNTSKHTLEFWKYEQYALEHYSYLEIPDFPIAVALSTDGSRGAFRLADSDTIYTIQIDPKTHVMMLAKEYTVVGGHSLKFIDDERLLITSKTGFTIISLNTNAKKVLQLPNGATIIVDAAQNTGHYVYTQPESDIANDDLFAGSFNAIDDTANTKKSFRIKRPASTIRSIGISPSGELIFCIPTLPSKKNARLYLYALPELSTRVIKHHNAIITATFSPDDMYCVGVIKAENSRYLIVWDTKTGDAHALLKTGDDDISRISWGTDGSLIAWYSTDTIHRWYDAISAFVLWGNLCTRTGLPIENPKGISLSRRSSYKY